MSSLTALLASSYLTFTKSRFSYTPWKSTHDPPTHRSPPNKMLSTISLNPGSSSFSPSSHSHPSTTLGLGRAPRLRSRFHTAKPYARSVSTQRAKKIPKSEFAIQPIKGRSRARAVFGEAVFQGNVKIEQKERELIKGMKSMGVDPMSRGTLPPKPEGVRFHYIPLEDLPMEVFPPIRDITANGQTIVSTFLHPHQPVSRFVRTQSFISMGKC
jgi:hypothetical protein